MRGLYFRLLVLSIAASAALTAVSLLFLNRLSEMSAAEHRERFLTFIAETIGDDIQDLSIDDILKKGDALLDEKNFHPRRFEDDARGMNRHHRLPPPPGPPPPGMLDRRGRFARLAPRLWIIDGSGSIVAKNSAEPLPELPPLPSAPLTLNSKKDFFRLNPRIYVVRLESPHPLYLVSTEPHRHFSGPLFGTQAVITFATVALAFLLSLSFVFVYLQRKSREARTVLRRLEQGDLKARFAIKRFDEYGGLINDFNRMAQEIETLVHRVQSTEATRRNLLQELGHDLRTPLTSLTTSLETIQGHHDAMSAPERHELFRMMEAEVHYLKDLLEKLMLIASLDEPSYRQNSESVDLADLLNHEMKARRNGSHLEWNMTSSQPGLLLSADPHLMRRLLKNALDNAARFAKNQVTAELRETQNEIVITIQDDGPGFSEEALSTFGQHRNKRTVQMGEKLGFSLGLGSVIMKAIAELHGGSVNIHNVESNRHTSGAVLTIRLPKSKNFNV